MRSGNVKGLINLIRQYRWQGRAQRLADESKHGAKLPTSPFRPLFLQLPPSSGLRIVWLSSLNFYLLQKSVPKSSAIWWNTNKEQYEPLTNWILQSTFLWLEKGEGNQIFQTKSFSRILLSSLPFFFILFVWLLQQIRPKKKTLKEGGFFLDGCPAVRFIQKHRLTLVLFTSAVYGSSCKKSISSHSQRVMDFTF